MHNTATPVRINGMKSWHQVYPDKAKVNVLVVQYGGGIFADK